MHCLSMIRTAAGGLSLLAVTTAFAAPHNLPVKHVAVPTYNIITDTLFSITPLVAGKRDTFFMKQICDLARGDASQQEVNQRLRQNKIDPQQLTTVGVAGILVINSERTDRQVACSAYLASSLFLPTAMTEYALEKDAAAKKGKASASWLPWARDEDKTPESAAFNQERFIQDARVQMALARATAQLYAVIAQNLPNRSPAEWATRQQQIAEIVRHYAPEYLKSIDSFYNAESKMPLTLESIDADGFRVRSANGNQLVKTGENLALYSRGVTWLGNGKIIGQDYFVDITIIPPAAKPAVVSEAPPKKK